MADVEVYAPQDMRTLPLVDTSSGDTSILDNTERLYATTTRTIEKANAYLMMAQKCHVPCWCDRFIVPKASTATKPLQVPLTTYSKWGTLWLAYSTYSDLFPSVAITGTIEVFRGVASVFAADIQMTQNNQTLAEIVQLTDSIVIGDGDNGDLGAVEMSIVVDNTSPGGAGTHDIILIGYLITPESMYSGPVPNV